MQNQPDHGASWSRLALIALAAASGAVFVALALAIAGGPLPIDVSVAEWLRPLRFGVAGLVVGAVNLLGQALVWDSLVVVIAAALWWKGLRFEAAMLIVGVVGAEAGASLAKLVVGRMRPPGIEVADLITQASFPSGHVTRAVVTAGILAALAWRRPSWRPAAVAGALALTLLMGVARIAVGEHWFTDVVGAALYGVFALAVIGLLGDVVRRAMTRA